MRTEPSTVTIKCGGAGTYSQQKALKQIEGLIRNASTTTWREGKWHPKAEYIYYLDDLSLERGGKPDVQIARQQRALASLARLKRDRRRKRKGRSARSEVVRPFEWFAPDVQGYRAILLELLRSNAPSEGHVTNNADGLATSEYIRIPLSWYRHIVRPFRATELAYHEAISVLAYVVGKYITGRYQGDLLYVRTELLCNLFGMSTDAEKKAVRFLVSEGYLTRVIIKGFLPWSPTTKGTYRLLLPVLDKLIQITYHLPRHEPSSESQG